MQKNTHKKTVDGFEQTFISWVVELEKQPDLASHVLARHIQNTFLNNPSIVCSKEEAIQIGTQFVRKLSALPACYDPPTTPWLELEEMKLIYEAISPYLKDEEERTHKVTHLQEMENKLAKYFTEKPPSELRWSRSPYKEVRRLKALSRLRELYVKKFSLFQSHDLNEQTPSPKKKLS